MGKYSSIWNRLKVEKLIVLAVPTRLQKRVIKGVIHTKNWDKIFAYECAMRGYREKIEYVQESARVTIRLRREVSVGTLMRAIDTSTNKIEVKIAELSAVSEIATSETTTETEGG